MRMSVYLKAFSIRDLRYLIKFNKSCLNSEQHVITKLVTRYLLLHTQRSQRMFQISRKDVEVLYE